MKYSIFATIVFGLVVTFASYASAGSRRGPVWQFGTAIYPVRQLSIAGASSRQTAAGISRSILLGYGVSEKLLVLLEFEHVGMRSKLLGNSRAFYDFTGLAAQRYLSGKLKWMYLTAGLGALDFYVVDDDYYSVGPAFLVGGGYEFAKHVEAGVRYLFGRTSYLGDDASHKLLIFSLCAKIY